MVCKDAGLRAAQWLAGRAGQRTGKHIAIVLPENCFPLLRNTSYMLLTTALQHELSRQRFEQVALVPWPAKERVTKIRSLPHKGFDAAIFIGCQAAHISSLCLLYEHGFPFVAFNRQIPGIPLPTVFIDRRSATVTLANRLMSLGHRNLCLVVHAVGTNTRDSDRGQEILAWLDALEQYGVLEDCLLPIYFAYSRDREKFMPGFVDFMHGRRHPTAVVFEEYQWAAAFLADPRFADLKVPDQISVAMLGPTRRVPSTQWAPPLTTADLDYERAAQCLVETLKHTIAGDTGASSIRLPLTLTMTESVGPSPAE